MERFEERVAIVTGAASGIGRAAALAFAREGAAVVAADTQDAVAQVAAEIEAAGGRALGLTIDVSRPADARRMVETAVERFGRLDALFNNAGIEGEQALTADSSEENWARVLAVNLTGPYLGMKYAIPALLASGGGAIVNNASVAGLVGFAGISAYVASKSGLVGLTRSVALEYATHHIRVNCICPGVIETPMIERFTAGDPQARAGLEAMEPVGRLGRSEEVAALALYLCSEEASFLTGAAIPIDGGLVAR